jgi:RNA polymerase sigma factor (TIGR02999 family)
VPEPGPPTADLLLDARLSDAERHERILPEVYADLRAAAQACLRGERAGHTLDATALVHEAWMRLVGPREVPWQNRAHFYAAAAQAMRRILVDHARAKATALRGGTEARRAAVELATLPDPSSERESAGFLILDAALSRLERVDPESASIVRLRYFAGLSVEDAALALGLSPAGVKRSWAFARGWLKHAIETDQDGASAPA